MFSGELTRRTTLPSSSHFPFSFVLFHSQRLEDEYNSDVIITAPSVPYKSKFVAAYCSFVDATFADSFPFRLSSSVVYTNGTETIVSNPSDFPDTIGPSIADIYAPMMIATILVPEGSSAVPPSRSSFLLFLSNPS